MQAFARRYVLLRAVQGAGRGFARLEWMHGRAGVHLRASGLPDAPVRALLLAGNAHAGAALDLGLVRREGDQGALSREGITMHTACHTLALVTDWPDAQLLMCGALRQAPLQPLWQLQETVRQYLAYPAEDSAPAPVDAPPPPGKSVLRLQPIAWPEELREVEERFCAGMPSAPLKLGGWRFARVALEDGDWCDVGVCVKEHRVQEVMYVLPHPSDEPGFEPVEGLHGLCWARRQRVAP